MRSHPAPSLSYHARRAVIERMAPRSQLAALAQKEALLDRVIDVTSYSRKYAIPVLNQPSTNLPIRRSLRQPKYGRRSSTPCSC
jgi:hypothetical protein